MRRVVRQKLISRANAYSLYRAHDVLISYETFLLVGRHKKQYLLSEPSSQLISGSVGNCYISFGSLCNTIFFSYKDFAFNLDFSLWLAMQILWQASFFQEPGTENNGNETKYILVSVGLLILVFWMLSREQQRIFFLLKVSWCYLSHELVEVHALLLSTFCDLLPLAHV